MKGVNVDKPSEKQKTKFWTLNWQLYTAKGITMPFLSKEESFKNIGALESKQEAIIAAADALGLYLEYHYNEYESLHVGGGAGTNQ